MGTSILTREMRVPWLPGLPELDSSRWRWRSFDDGTSMPYPADQFGGLLRLLNVGPEGDGLGPVVEGNPAGSAAFARA
jgi:hypothetical protein